VGEEENRQMTGTTNVKKFSIHKNARGITLVELIVVLTILVILAGGGIFAATGYARRSIIEQNQSNAETIYQSAQAALQQLQKAGGIYSQSEKKFVRINDWVEKLVNKGTTYAFVESNMSEDMKENKSYYMLRYDSANFSAFDASTADTNASVHMRYILTYSKNSADSAQSVILKDLLQPYFSDASVFGGTMTLEFDVEKTADAYGKEHLAAKCLSVFYDGRAEQGWSSRAYKGSDTTVPTRETQFRNETSFIGYYDGYKGTAVDTVYLPKVQEGIVVKKFMAEYETVIVTPEVTNAPVNTTTPEPTPIEEKHTRIVWAATLDKENLTGSSKDVYYRITLMSGTDVSKVLILNEDFLLNDDQINGNKHKFDYFSAFKDDQTTINGKTVTTETYTAVYSDTVTHEVTKKSIEVIAKVFVVSYDESDYRGMNKDQINAKIVEMPLRISYVTGELDYKSDTDHPVKSPYIEYSLDLTGGEDKTVLTEQMDSAVIRIYPNYFTDSVMAGTNDDTGIIGFKKGTDADIEHEETTGGAAP